jgi:hypothetical protein
MIEKYIKLFKIKLKLKLNIIEIKNYFKLVNNLIFKNLLNEYRLRDLLYIILINNLTFISF